VIKNVSDEELFSPVYLKSESQKVLKEIKSLEL